MIKQDILAGLRNALERGETLGEAKESLINAGYPREEVEEAAATLSKTEEMMEIEDVVPVPKEEAVAVKEKMTKKLLPYLIIVAAVIIIVASAYFFLMKEQSPSGGLINCKTDVDCFIEASEDCSPAKVTHIYPIEILGMEQITTSYYELKGMEANKCIFYIRTENVDVKFSNELVQQMLDAEATQEEIEQQEQEANRQADIAEGRNGTCKFSTNDLTQMLNRWKAGVFDFGTTSCELTPSGTTECTTVGGDFGVAECQGKYFTHQA